jgi:uncharacterized membrane protein
MIFCKEEVMEKNTAKENFIMKGIAEFLLDKPIWVWWLSYILATGALFGVFYLALYLLTIQAWVAVLILLITGIIWGTVAYSHKNLKVKEQKNSEEVK